MERTARVRRCRSQARQFVALIVIGAATAQVLGLTLRMSTQLGANDISRWCTVWSLLERGTYAIDECPWQSRTQDKVAAARAVPAGRPEGEPPVEHFYSSKPPLLPDADRRRPLSVPHGDGRPERRARARSVRSEPSQRRRRPVEVKLETPDPVKWPVHVFYLKPIVVLLNVVPLWVFLVLYARLLDRYAENDWAWFLSLVRGRLGHPALRVRRDPEQPHDRRLQRLLRDLCLASGSGTTATPAGALRPGRLLRRLLRLQRAAGRAVRRPALRDAAVAVPPADAALLRAGGGGPLRGVPGVQYPAVGQLMPVYRSSGRSRTSSRGATGPRRWRWTPWTSRSPSTCST